ncbi:MAG: hypothetical protein ABFE07_25745 [Armatimonadia bacterium]
MNALESIHRAFIRLGLRPLMSLLCWFAMAFSIWLLCGFLFRSFPDYFLASPDNERYFFSAAAQAIAAVGGLVFVATFAAIQTTASRGVAPGILTFVTCDYLLHGVIAFTLVGILIPLYCTLIVSASGWPASFSATGATVIFLPLVLFMVAAYALSIPKHSSPDRCLESMLNTLPEIVDDTSTSAVEIIEGTIDGYMREFVRALSLGDYLGTNLAIGQLCTATVGLYVQRAPIRYAERILRAWRICAAQVATTAPPGKVRDEEYQTIIQQLSYCSKAVFWYGDRRGASSFNALFVEMTAAAVDGGYGYAYYDYWDNLQDIMISTVESDLPDPDAVQHFMAKTDAWLEQAHLLLVRELDRGGATNVCMRLQRLFNTLNDARFEDAPSLVLLAPLMRSLKAHSGAMLAGLGSGVVTSKPVLLKQLLGTLQEFLDSGQLDPELILCTQAAVAEDKAVRRYASATHWALRPEDERNPPVSERDMNWKLASQAFYHLLCLQIRPWLREASHMEIARNLTDVTIDNTQSRFIIDLWQAQWPGGDMPKMVREYVSYLKSMKTSAG